MQTPNMRDYFDRRVNKVDIPVCPRQRLRPVWVLDVPEQEPINQVYRIFDPATASWKVQKQWAYKKEEVDYVIRQNEALEEATAKAVAGLAGETPHQLDSTEAGKPKPPARQPRQRPRPLPPNYSEDLKVQRTKESSWNKGHGVVFSRFNDEFQVNLRSYFDRWKDEGLSGPPELPWRLPVERKPLIAHSASDPLMETRGTLRERQWVGNF